MRSALSFLAVLGGAAAAGPGSWGPPGQYGDSQPPVYGTGVTTSTESTQTHPVPSGYQSLPPYRAGPSGHTSLQGHPTGAPPGQYPSGWAPGPSGQAPPHYPHPRPSGYQPSQGYHIPSGSGHLYPTQPHPTQPFPTGSGSPPPPSTTTETITSYYTGTSILYITESLTHPVVSTHTSFIVQSSPVATTSGTTFYTSSLTTTRTTTTYMTTETLTHTLHPSPVSPAEYTSIPVVPNQPGGNVVPPVEGACTCPSPVVETSISISYVTMPAAPTTVTVAAPTVTVTQTLGQQPPYPYKPSHQGSGSPYATGSGSGAAHPTSGYHPGFSRPSGTGVARRV